MTNHKRFFGLVNLYGRKVSDVFNEKGELVNKELGVPTVEMDTGNRFNAVLYHGVPNDVLNTIDAEEKDVHLRRVRLSKKHIRTFNEFKLWEGNTDPFFYVAEDFIVVPEGKFRIVRKNVRPDIGYLKRYREAALFHGKTFRDAFDETTFLADGETPLSKTEYIRL